MVSYVVLLYEILWQAHLVQVSYYVESFEIFPVLLLVLFSLHRDSMLEVLQWEV